MVDDRIPEERQRQLRAEMAWCTLSEAAVVYVDYGITLAMLGGIRLAMRCAKLIEYRAFDLSLEQIRGVVESGKVHTERSCKTVVAWIPGRRGG